MTFIPHTNLAEWHLTYKCNLRCVGCNRMSAVPNHTPDMTLNDAEQFLEQAKEIDWSPTVILIGGEPTLHPELEQFVTLAYDATQVPVRLYSNGYSDASRAMLQRYIDDDRVWIANFTIKTKAVIAYPILDYYLAPCDLGYQVMRAPCDQHSTNTTCGISVDSYGYTVCAVGGMIDGVLGLGLRTKRLADLFDPEFAAHQTAELCIRCGCKWSGNQRFSNVTVVDGVQMSPTWSHAIERHRTSD